MGGVEAMVSSPDFVIEDETTKDKDSGAALHPEETNRQGEAFGGGGGGSREIVAEKPKAQDVVKEERLPSPLKSPRHTSQEDHFQTDQQLKTASKTRGSKSPERSSVEQNENLLTPGSSEAVSPNQMDTTVVIDPPSPWRRRSPSSKEWQEPASTGSEDNLAGVRKLTVF